MNRQIYPTIKDFKNMGLSDYQITRLIELENNKHYFRQQFKNTTHYSEPNSIFFLDIKDTLYHSSGHGNSGVLGRAGDSLQIFMRDVLALGSLLEKSTGQNLTMNLYSLCEDNSMKIEYNFPTDVQNAKYKMDIPFKQINDTFTNRVINQSNVGPYKTVFVSADSVETQKKIILFLLLVYKIYLNGSFRVYRGESASCIDSQEILKLEKLFEICNCDYDKFIANLPQEHSNVFDHYTKIKIEKIMNDIIFLSTKDSNLTKVELMKTFLADYNIKKWFVL